MISLEFTFGYNLLLIKEACQGGLPGCFCLTILCHPSQMAIFHDDSHKKRQLQGCLRQEQAVLPSLITRMSPKEMIASMLKIISRAQLKDLPRPTNHLPELTGL